MNIKGYTGGQLTCHKMGYTLLWLYLYVPEATCNLHSFNKIIYSNRGSLTQFPENTGDFKFANDLLEYTGQFISKGGNSFPTLEIDIEEIRR